MVLVAGAGVALGTWWVRGDAEPSPAGSAPIPSRSAGDVTASSSPPPEPLTPMVLAISVDGLNPEAIEVLGRSGAPTLHRLIDEGASTVDARNSDELTITLPNHTGMLTGRGVTGPEGHGVTFNRDDGGTLLGVHGSYVPGVFDVAHDHGLRTAFLAEKDKFLFLIRSWDATHGADDTTGADDGRDKTDLDLVGEHAAVMDRAVKVVRSGRYDLTFLHLKGPDEAGHASGWLGDRYLEAVRQVDRDLARFLEVVDASPRLRDRLTILITSDHGGPRGRTSHSDVRLLANHRIPFIAWGRDVEPGSDLYEINPRRRDPGDRVPPYDGPQPIRNLDLRTTALELLALPSSGEGVASGWPAVRLR